MKSNSFIQEKAALKHGFVFPFVMLFHIITNFFNYFLINSMAFILYKTINITDISVNSSFEMVGTSLNEAAQFYKQKKAV